MKKEKKVDKEKIKKQRTNLVNEFKTFISRGSFIDMAVGIVVGGAFTTMVNTLVNNIFTPLINAVIYWIMGGNSDAFKGLDVTLIPAVYDENNNLISKATVLGISNLISAILNFFLVALVLFFILKIINKIRAESEAIKEKMLQELKAKEEKLNKEKCKQEESKEATSK